MGIATIRFATETDAENLLELRLALDSETNFMLLEPGERPNSVEIHRQRIKDLLSAGNSTLLVAEVDGKIVGFLQGRGGSYRRTKHCLDIVVGVLQAYVGKGIGRALFHEVETWARAHHLQRLELTVMAHNAPGIHLYQSVGFVIEGTKSKSLVVNGHFVDEIMMGKLLVDG